MIVLQVANICFLLIVAAWSLAQESLYRIRISFCFFDLSRLLLPLLFRLRKLLLRKSLHDLIIEKE